jgi:ATP-dependent exoDNAse (exonuclease V) beta subunit
MSLPFHIYRSSAGSGKTFTLAKEYIRLALSKPQGFREILGVTFTNKATEEMKSRIVEILEVLSEGQVHPMTDYLVESLEIDQSTLRKRAKDALTDILHQYGRFSVVTIDSFFHQVIRSFAKEMGLQGTFSIDLDLNNVMERVIDNMLLDVGKEEHLALRKWLTEFAENRVEEGANWDFRAEIKKLAAETLKEEFKAHSKAIAELSKSPELFGNIKKALNSTINNFKNKVAKICEEAIELIEARGIDPSLYKGGSTQSPAWIFYRIIGKKYDITKTQQAKYGQPETWIKAKDPNEPLLAGALGAGLATLYDQLIDHINQHLISYNSALETFRYLYTYGILAEINNYLEKYREDNDVMLIADLPDFLNQIISDSETPYIYEKVGSRFAHYLIDEFQDTSSFQWDNFRPLVKNAADQQDFSMVVGDVKQSIYRFRGGDWELLQSTVKEDIGGAFAHEIIKEENLDINWRSDPNVIKFNNELFLKSMDVSMDFFLKSIEEVQDENIKKRIQVQIAEAFGIYHDVAQKVAPHKKDKEFGAVRVEFIPDERGAEVHWKEESIARTIEQVEILQRKGYELRDIAVLTRWNSEGRKLADAFVQYKNSKSADPSLRYDVISSEALYLTSSHVVRFMVSLIKWLQDEANTVVLTEWYYEYRKYIRKDPQLDHEIITTYLSWAEYVPEAFVQQKDFIKSLPVFELVEEVIRVFQLARIKEEITYLQGFQDAILDYSKNERGDIASFLEWWEEVRKNRAIQVSDDNNAIKILTIHKSKGLEFPIVLIPFLNWSADHIMSGNRDTIIWCPGGEQAPYDKLPIIPLRYGQGLTNTYWAEYYYQERLKVFLDNVNVLYVALTRAVNYLWIGAPKPKNPASLTSINDLLFNALHTEGWKEEGALWEKGVLAESDAVKEDISEYALITYHSHYWRNKIAIKKSMSSQLGANPFLEATQKGIKIHDLLSKVKHLSDLELLDEPNRLKIENIVRNEGITSWFDSQWKVDVEVPIVLPGGDVKRLDRINTNSEETIIIDYKTGDPRSKDQKQVAEYIKLMLQMGRTNVSGRLIYLQDLKVVTVEV